jgi:hypothetical protein
MPNQPKTKPSTYRFDADLIGLVDRLGARLGGLDRTAVLRLAVRRLADAELAAEGLKKNPKKSRPVY